MEGINKNKRVFAKGADIGWLTQLEKMGVTWLNEMGVTEDPLVILKAAGINAVRLRVFVNPPSEFRWTKKDGSECLLGEVDEAGMVRLAVRAHNLGFQIMVNFHYSDHFADPAYQDTPFEWRGYSFDELKRKVSDHTSSVMEELANYNINPEWVQIGNEINHGMLLPYGRLSDFERLTELLNAGYEAVKMSDNRVEVITHLADGHSNEVFRNFFDSFLLKYGGKTDIIGVSYYPYWIKSTVDETIDLLSQNLNEMAVRYGKDVMVCEVGGLESEPENTYELIKKTIDRVKAVPNQRGLGVFYWEPEANSILLPDQYPLCATRQVKERVLQFTSALNAFK